MAEGSEIWFEGEADETPGQEPGDILMKIVQAKDPRLTRNGDDLHMTQKINLKEALLGFKKTFVHLDGHEVEIASDKITKPFQVVRIKGEGMPKVRGHAACAELLHSVSHTAFLLHCAAQLPDGVWRLARQVRHHLPQGDA